jgi:hypothetical protein
VATYGVDTYGATAYGSSPALSGGGALSAAGRRATASSLTLSGGGSLAVAGHGFDSSLHLSGGGTLSAAGRRSARGSAGLSGGGALALGGTRITTAVISVPVTEVTIAPLTVTLGAATPPGPASLVLAVPNTTVQSAPGSVVVFALNGTEGGPVTVTVGSSTITTTFDSQGLLNGMSIPVRAASPGTYTLTATDTTTSATATQAITVSAIDTPGSVGGGTVTAPPANVQPGTGVKKWVFQDPATSDVYHFAINPNTMNSPYGPKKIEFAATTAIDGQKLAFEGQSPPVEWQFSGTLLAQAQYDAFVTWSQKRNRIWVTDHYGRAWLCYITNFQPTAKRSHQFPWAHDWEMTVLIFDGPVNPT